jgi:hypothetical protein
MDVGSPVLLVPTVALEPLGECVITLPPGVAPEASVEC